MQDPSSSNKTRSQLWEQLGSCRRTSLRNRVDLTRLRADACARRTAVGQASQSLQGREAPKRESLPDNGTIAGQLLSWCAKLAARSCGDGRDLKQDAEAEGGDEGAAEKAKGVPHCCWRARKREGKKQSPVREARTRGSQTARRIF